MASNIDPTKPEDGAPAVKADLRANLQAAKDEIEALQTAVLPPGGTAGQRLTKLSGADFDVAWQTPGAVGGTEVPFGFVSPEDYGASGAGSDDHTALSNMFQGAKAAGKGVWFPPGKVYHIADRIFVEDWTDFVIHGNGATIRRHGSWDISGGPAGGHRMMTWTDCKRFTLNHLVIDGNRSVVTPVDEHDHNFELRDNCEDFHLDQLKCINGCGDGLYIAALPATADDPSTHAYRGTLTNCVFDNNYRNGITHDYGHDMLHVNCQFLNTNGTRPGAGCDIEPIKSIDPATALGASNFTFVGCLFQDNEGAGLQLVPHAEWLLEGVTVMGCVFDHNGIIPFGDSAQLNRGALILKGRNLQVLGNSFINHTDGGVGHDQPKLCVEVKASADRRSPAKAHAIVFSGNTFKNNTACTYLFGIQRMIDGAREPSVRLIVSNNVFDMSDGMSLATGSPGPEDNTRCAVSWKRNDTMFVDNYILGDGVADGIRIVTTSRGRSASRRNVVDSNRIEDCANAIVLPGSGIPQASVWGNYLSNNTTDVADGGGGAARLGPQVSF